MQSGFCNPAITILPMPGHGTWRLTLVDTQLGAALRARPAAGRTYRDRYRVSMSYVLSNSAGAVIQI